MSFRNFHQFICLKQAANYSKTLDFLLRQYRTSDTIMLKIILSPDTARYTARYFTVFSDKKWIDLLASLNRVKILLYFGVFIDLIY